jgi:hypothetical protein
MMAIKNFARKIVVSFIEKGTFCFPAGLGVGKSRELIFLKMRVFDPKFL